MVVVLAILPGRLQPLDYMVVCIYEDRPQQFVGVKLLLLSLLRHCSDWRLRLYAPNLVSEQVQWLLRHPSVDVVEARLSGAGSYNVKPAVLLDSLDRGDEKCLWLDTDILVNGSLKFLVDESPDVVIVSQDPWEYPEGSSFRCSAWGLEEGRSLPGPLNTAVVRITRQHRRLIESWRQLLDNPAYRVEQRKPVRERNGLLLSDQDGLSALLASSEYANIRVRRLGHAGEVLQHHGAGAYGLRERRQHRRSGLPPLVHAMGTVKPWLRKRRVSPFTSPRDYYESLYLELSPYMHLAGNYQSELDEDVGWLRERTFASVVSEWISGHDPVRAGTFQATLHRLLSRSIPRWKDLDVRSEQGDG